MFQALDIKSEYNKKHIVSLEINGERIELEIFMEYNAIAGYWVATIKDMQKNEYVATSLPVLSGQNILGQMEYLKIGIALVLPISDKNPDQLNDKNLGTDFMVVWSDNV